jgi:cation diffusion facilitator CzcD-associated flavoprotein CzcO
VDTPLEHVDVLIVGAGLSGIGAAHHLQQKCPGRSYAIFEARDAIGGTWDLFRYPGIRSDSDMYTLGYSFRPWENAKAIADGPSILEYVRDTARQGGIEQRIRYGHRVTRAEWSSDDARWTVSAEVGGGSDVVKISCSFVYVCSGYYRYDQGYIPEFEGIERFAGEVIHPQHWPENLEYAGKRVVVIGSGATAVTLVPAMAEQAAHVTMLQRSPSYVISLPSEDVIANGLRRVLPSKVAYSITRWKNVLQTMFSFELSRRRPEVMKRLLRRLLVRELPAGYPVDVHFKPSYNPWEQRLCLVPDADLFKALGKGSAEIVTDRIASFTETGLQLESGAELEADMIITATGLNLQVLGGMELVVDGEHVSLPDTIGYKGMMLSGVPNMAFAFGYTNASWTLKADLTSEYVCRLLNHMRDHGYRTCVPVNDDPTVTPLPFVDFSSGYIQRAIDRFPKQGSRAPWRLYQNYARDIVMLRRSPIEDGSLRFDPAAARLAPDMVTAA